MVSVKVRRAMLGDRFPGSSAPLDITLMVEAVTGARAGMLVAALVVTGRKKGKLGANAMKRVIAGAHLPTPWLFEPAKRPDTRR